MNRFNLCFKGEIHPGKDPQQARLKVAELLGVTDPEQLDRFFSGANVVLLEDLDRKSAAEYYSQLNRVGAAVKLVKITASSTTESGETVPEKGGIQSAPGEIPTPLPVAETPPVQPAAGDQGSHQERPAVEHRMGDEEHKEEARRKAAQEKKRRAREAAAQAKAKLQQEQRKAAQEKQKKAERAAAQLREEQRRSAQEDQERAEEAARNEARLQEEQHAADLEQQKTARQSAPSEAVPQKEQHKRPEPAEPDSVPKTEPAKGTGGETDRQRGRNVRQAGNERGATEQVERRRAARTERERRDALEQERRAAKEAARRTADQAVARHRAAVADRQHREAEKERILSARAEAIAQRKAMEEVTVQRAATELSRQPSLAPVDARVKTRLEVPRDESTPLVRETGEQVRARQRAGIPNLYSLRPFRNSPAIKARHDVSRKLARKSYQLATVALACLLILVAQYINRPLEQPVNGARAMAIPTGSGPVLLAGDQLLIHDRAGFARESIDLVELGLAQLGEPMLFTEAGDLLAVGSLRLEDQAEIDQRQILRCDLQELACVNHGPTLTGSQITAMVLHPLTGDLLVADRAAQQLIRISSDGELLASSDISLAEHPVLRVASGLLFTNSSDGPAISVLRYDDAAFGQQLDEILLLPPPAIAAEQVSVWDFNRAGDAWWVTLYNPATSSVGVYRFDEKWNYIDQLAIPENTWPEQLASWGEKTLLRDPLQVPLLRFNAEGKPEAPLVSSLLENLVGGLRKMQWMTDMAWHAGLLLLAVLVATGLCRGILHSTRALVYRPGRERGAAPVDDLGTTLRWVAPAQDRAARTKRSATAYAALVLVLLSLAIAAQVPVIHLVALLVVLCGPAIFLTMFYRSPRGHIGIAPGQLLLADHRGNYHLGANARLQHRGAFLLIDDVVVFAGTPLLPAFDTQQVQEEVAALASTGVRIDRKTLIIKLLECNHPLARGAIAIAACLAIASLLLVISL